MLAACGPRTPHDVTAALISAVERKDIDAVKKLLVSPEQVAGLIECTGHHTWYTRAGRAEWISEQLAEYTHHDPASSGVALGDLWEEYDNPAQWHAYRPGDPVDGPDCHAKAAFEIQVYRIELHIEKQYSSAVTSTKPVELWRIDGSWLVWDNPLNAEGW